MTKKIIFISVTLLLIAALGYGLTLVQSIHIEWGYTPPNAPAVSGFKLYQEGVFACQTLDPNATAMDCTVALAQSTTNFTLTASFVDDTESPHSSPFAFTPSISKFPRDFKINN